MSACESREPSAAPNTTYKVAQPRMLADILLERHYYDCVQHQGRLVACECCFSRCNYFVLAANIEWLSKTVGRDRCLFSNAVDRLGGEVKTVPLV